MDAYYENIYSEKENLFTHPPFYIEQKIVNAIATGNMEEAIRNLRIINEKEKAVLADDPLRSAKNSMICSCTFYARAAISSGIAPDIAFVYSDALIQNLEKINKLPEVLAYEEIMLTTYVQLVQEFLKQKYPPVVVYAMQYIDSNLTRRLQLKEIAEQVHVHPNYLSSVFKKKTGVSLTEYMNRQKVKEASYYVAHTDYEIADIANLYKFCNQGYFITVFKNYFGQTPTQYKKSIQFQKEKEPKIL